MFFQFFFDNLTCLISQLLRFFFSFLFCKVTTYWISVQPSCQEIKFVMNVSANRRYSNFVCHIGTYVPLYIIVTFAQICHIICLLLDLHIGRWGSLSLRFGICKYEPLDGFKAGQQCLNFFFSTCKHQIFLGRTCGRLAALFVPTETLFTQSQGHLLPCSW